MINWSVDLGNIIIGLLAITVSIFIARSGKEDAKKFADAAQKASNEAEKNRQITQRVSVISHLVMVKKMLKAFDEKKEIRVGNLREMGDSLSHLFAVSDKFDFLKPIEPMVERLISFVRLSSENDIADHWCKETQINKDLARIELKNIIDELGRVEKDFNLGL